MDKSQIEQLGYEIASNIQSVLKLDVDSIELTRIRNVVDLTIGANTSAASVPERMFATELVEYLVRIVPDLSLGYFNEEEIREYKEEIAEDYPDTLEMFVNPTNLFLNGKIRPDVVFRKGSGNYIIFEVDSFAYHSSQEQLMKDKVRERKIQGLGYPVYRFAAKEILAPAGSYACAIEAIEALKRHGFV